MLKENLPKDDEAMNEWKKWIAPERILLGNKKDNFWEMGDTGPCGPCTEIHVDTRSDEERKFTPGKDLVNNDHPQVIEIWNNVFIQFNRLKDGSLEALPAKHVDTGMGFERLVRVIQNKQSNYDTDVFTATIAATAAITNKNYQFSDTKADVAFRVIADHIRAICFTIADGQLPSNTGAGYVIRRILRRAVRYSFSYLDYKQPLLNRLIPVIAEQFKTVFPELISQLEFVTKVVKEEEESFLRTLDKGLKKIDEIIANTKNTSTNIINGKAAFELFDTYGFPIDLTRLIAQENDLQVDEDAFEKEMHQQKTRSRAATTLDTEDWIVLSEDSSAYAGYEALETTSFVTKYRKVTSKGKEAYQMVIASTPFYAESGGQVGDTGVMLFGDEQVNVIDTKKENNLIIHFIDALPTQISSQVIARVNVEQRKKIAAHHSATHLLHAALRQVLGAHVMQKGSLVNGDQLRFDFAHFSKVTDEEIEKIEGIVNEKIRQNLPVTIKQMSKDEAIALGAMALFGEKYGDVVRVVMMDPQYSIELCGGTHVAQTGELGFFKIKHESAVAAGVRRIEAVSGYAAELLINEAFTNAQQIKVLLKNSKDPKKSIENLQEENAELKKRLESLEAKQLAVQQKDLLLKSEQINGTSFIGTIVEISSPDLLKKLAIDLKNTADNIVVILAATIESKAQVVVAISDSASERTGLQAQQLVKQHVAPLIKGGGGGQKNLANAGGQDARNLPMLIETVKNLLR